MKVLKLRHLKYFSFILLHILLLVKDGRGKCCAKVCAESPDETCQSPDEPIKIKVDALPADAPAIKKMSKEVAGCPKRAKFLQDKISSMKNILAANEKRIEELKKLAEATVAKSCDDVKRNMTQPWKKTGTVAYIHPEHSNGSKIFPKPIRVYCEVNEDGENWMVFQRRMDGSVPFERTWKEYSQGFGNLDGEFWLGLEILHKMTMASDYMLKLDMGKFDGTETAAVYWLFKVGSNSTKYYTEFGQYNSTGNTALNRVYYRNAVFQTYDHYSYGFHCSTFHDLGWWKWGYDWGANLNRKYFKKERYYWDYPGIYWSGSYNLKFTEMKIRKI